MINETEKDGIRLLTVTPDTTLSDILEYGTIRQPEWKGCDICWILDNFDFDTFTASEVRKIAQTMIAKITRDPGRKTACVTPSDMGFGMLRMLEMLLPENLPVSYRVFRTTDDALNWIAGIIPNK